MRAQYAAALLTLAPMLCACANMGPPPPPPTLQVDARNCTATANLGNAVPLTIGGHNDSQTVLVDSSALCLEQMPGQKSLYRTFVLPPSDTPYVVTVASTPLGIGVFAPHLVLLDANGKPVREIPRDQFLFHGSDLSVLFRSHPDERYLLVASDPSSVGKEFSRVQETVAATPMAAGGAYFVMHTGSDSQSNLVYSHTGEVTVSLSPVPSPK